jgi:hypothetical protein
MELPTFPLSFTRRKVVDKRPYKRNGEREWISQCEGFGQAFRRVSDRYADRIFVAQGEKHAPLWLGTKTKFGWDSQVRLD